MTNASDSHGNRCVRTEHLLLLHFRVRSGSIPAADSPKRTLIRSLAYVGVPGGSGFNFCQFISRSSLIIPGWDLLRRVILFHPGQLIRSARSLSWFSLPRMLWSFSKTCTSLLLSMPYTLSHLIFRIISKNRTWRAWHLRVPGATTAIHSVPVSKKKVSMAEILR